MVLISSKVFEAAWASLLVTTKIQLALSTSVVHLPQIAMATSETQLSAMANVGTIQAEQHNKKRRREEPSNIDAIGAWRNKPIMPDLLIPSQYMPQGRCLVMIVKGEGKPAAEIPLKGKCAFVHGIYKPKTSEDRIVYNIGNAVLEHGVRPDEAEDAILLIEPKRTFGGATETEEDPFPLRADVRTKLDRLLNCQFNWGRAGVGGGDWLYSIRGEHLDTLSANDAHNIGTQCVAYQIKEIPGPRQYGDRTLYLSKPVDCYVAEISALQ